MARLLGPIRRSPATTASTTPGSAMPCWAKAEVPVTALDGWRVARLLEWAMASADQRKEICCDWSEEPK